MKIMFQKLILNLMDEIEFLNESLPWKCRIGKVQKSWDRSLTEAVKICYTPAIALIPLIRAN